ncbi:MAG TPA: acyltransferase [Candidatus Baltobacteraceae bacterium]|jgi:acetyltransferase-like isoleucine patch superfamily enzyme|nr:acyltransferase [Candidatus Baltobacteraceae bacterium]
MAVHPTAIIEPDVLIGKNTAVWDNVHIRHSSRIGADCIVGEKSYIAYGVRIDDKVKINAFVYVCTGVEIERGVMIAAGVTFTNDRYPRAATADFERLLPSEPTDATLQTIVREGATIGAGATIGPGITIGRFAMIGMGSVVTHDVQDFSVVCGNPARIVGHACSCGERLADVAAASPAGTACYACGAQYVFRGSQVVPESVA